MAGDEKKLCSTPFIFHYSVLESLWSKHHKQMLIIFKALQDFQNHLGLYNFWLEHQKIQDGDQKVIKYLNSYGIDLNNNATWLFRVFLSSSFVCHSSSFASHLYPSPNFVFFSLFVPYLITNPNKLLPSESLAILIAFSHEPLPRR